MVLEEKSPHKPPASILTHDPPLQGVKFAAMGLLDSGILVSIYSFDEEHLSNIEQARKLVG
jgi:hypothetical protein